MKKLFFSLFTVSVLFWPANSLAAVSLFELSQNPRLFDRKIIEVAGEVIGEPSRSGDGVWFNIIENGSHLGVHAQDAGVLEAISYWGAYGVKGDEVRISGEFFSQCPRHGTYDLHLISLSLEKPGARLDVGPSPFKKTAALWSFTICLTMALIYFIKIRVSSANNGYINE